MILSREFFKNSLPEQQFVPTWGFQWVGGSYRLPDQRVDSSLSYRISMS